MYLRIRRTATCRCTWENAYSESCFDMMENVARNYELKLYACGGDVSCVLLCVITKTDLLFIEHSGGVRVCYIYIYIYMCVCVCVCVCMYVCMYVWTSTYIHISTWIVRVPDPSYVCLHSTVNFWKFTLLLIPVKFAGVITVDSWKFAALPVCMCCKFVEIHLTPSLLELCKPYKQQTRLIYLA